VVSLSRNGSTMLLFLPLFLHVFPLLKSTEDADIVTDITQPSVQTIINSCELRGAGFNLQEVIPPALEAATRRPWVFGFLVGVGEFIRPWVSGEFPRSGEFEAMPLGEWHRRQDRKGNSTQPDHLSAWARSDVETRSMHEQ
jgi:hypothetical protein